MMQDLGGLHKQKTKYGQGDTFESIYNYAGVGQDCPRQTEIHDHVRVNPMEDEFIS